MSILIFAAFVVNYTSQLMKNDVNEYRRILLADNYLEWGINGEWIDAIMKRYSKSITYLDLSQNAFTSDDFLVWSVFFFL